MRSLKAQLSESQKKLAVIHKYNDRLFSLAGREDQGDNDMFDDYRVIGSQIDAMREEQRQRLEDSKMYEEDNEELYERQQLRRQDQGKGREGKEIEDEDRREDRQGFRQKKGMMNVRQDNNQEDEKEYQQRNMEDNSRRIQAPRQDNNSGLYQDDNRFRRDDQEFQNDQYQQQQSRQKWKRNEEVDQQQNSSSIKPQKDLRYQQQQPQQQQQNYQDNDVYLHNSQRERKHQRMNQEVEREMERQEINQGKYQEQEQDQQYNNKKQQQMPGKYKDNSKTEDKNSKNMYNSPQNSSEQQQQLTGSRQKQIQFQDQNYMDKQDYQDFQEEEEEQKYAQDQNTHPKPQKLKYQSEQKQSKYPSSIKTDKEASKISNNNSSSNKKKGNSSYLVNNQSEPDSSIYVIVDNKKSSKKSKNYQSIEQNKQNSKISNYEVQDIVYPPMVSPFSQYIPDQRDYMNNQGYNNRSKLVTQYPAREYLEDRNDINNNNYINPSRIYDPAMDQYYNSSRYPQEILDQYAYQGDNQNINRIHTQNTSQMNSSYIPYSRECNVKITEINETQEQVEEEEQQIVIPPQSIPVVKEIETSMKESQQEEEDNNNLNNRGSFDPHLNKNYFKYLKMREDIDKENGVNQEQQDNEIDDKQQQQILNPAKEMTSVSIQTSAWLKDSIKQTNEESEHLSEESPKPYVPFDPHLNKNYFKFLDMEEQIKKEKEQKNNSNNDVGNNINSSVNKRKYDDDQQVSFAGSKQDEYENEQRKMKDLLGEQEEIDRIQPKEVGLGDINNSQSQNLRRNEQPMVSQQKQQQQQQNYLPQQLSDDKQLKNKEINQYPMSQTLKQSFLMLSTKPAKPTTVVSPQSQQQQQQQQLGNNLPLQFSNAQIVGSLQQINQQDPIYQSSQQRNQPRKYNNQEDTIKKGQKQIEESLLVDQQQQQPQQQNMKQLQKSKFQPKDNLVTSNAYSTPIRSQQLINRSEIKDSIVSSTKDEYYYQDQEAIGLQPDQPFPILNKQQDNNNNTLKVNQNKSSRDNNRIQSTTPDKGISSVRSPSPNLAKLSKLQAQRN